MVEKVLTAELFWASAISKHSIYHLFLFLPATCVYILFQEGNIVIYGRLP